MDRLCTLPVFWAKLCSVKTHLTRSANEAAEFIKHGGIVAFPTETVYGLGANLFDQHAIRKIFEAKKRPADNPLIAHIGSFDQLPRLVAYIPANAQKLIGAFFPGPLTIVLKKMAAVPLLATAGLETIGVRMPRHPLARDFLKFSGVAVAAPSANLSGRPSPTTWQAVHEDLDGRIDCILQDDAAQIGLESTVVDCTSAIPILLRKGAVPLERLRKFVAEMRDVEGVDADDPRSPGLKHKHYSPQAKVLIVASVEELNADPEDAFIGLRRPAGELKTKLVCRDVDEYAHSLFEFFRDCDRLGVRRVFCQAVDEQGIGAALMDRIRRAAAS